MAYYGRVNVNNFSISNRAEQFDKWTNSEENYNKSIRKQDVEPFKAVDMNGDKPYNQALKDFAQEYINLFDNNGDGVWNFDEFLDMSCGELINQELEFYKKFCDEEQLDTIKKDLKSLLAPSNKMFFEDLNLDDKKDEINAGEFASMLMLCDLEKNEAYYEYGITADSIDGEISYEKYIELGEAPLNDYKTAIWSKQERQDFYDNFYAD